jgi:hypothetical protein
MMRIILYCYKCYTRVSSRKSWFGGMLR